MAFNPFNVFRRNQKTLFAVLTVFIMIMFTLSFGQGDLFQMIPRWLGSKTRTGEVVAVVDGSKVYQSELETTRTDRVLANQFMANALFKATQALTATIKDQQATATAPTKAVVEEISTGYSMIQFALMDPQQGQRFLGQGQQALATARPKLQAILDNEKSTRDDIDVATSARNLVSAATQILRLSQGAPYFRVTNEPRKDAFSALLWLKKADQLGIKFKADDVQNLIGGDLFGKFSAADYKDIETALLKNKSGDFPPARLQTALANEFKIRAAQSVLIGALNPRATFDAPQAVSAPSEGLAYYRELSSGAQIGFITVPVDNYLSKVPGLPTEAEKQELFTKYRNDEPDPTKDRPGLKEPRKLKLEWLEAKGDEPFYKAAAADGLVKGDVQAKLGAALVAPLFAAGWSQVAAPAAFGLKDGYLDKTYDDFKKQQDNALSDSWYPFSQIFSKPVGATTVKPRNLVAAGGVAAGSLVSFGTPFSSTFTAAVVFQTAAWHEDRNARVRVFASLLAPPVLSPATVFGGYAAAKAREPQPLPLAVVRPELVEKVKTDLQYSMATADLNKFGEELAKLGQNKDKAEARAYVAKFVKERGLKLGASEQFRDQYTIGQDPGLAPLKSRFERNSFAVNQFVPFGPEFFIEADPNQDMMAVFQGKQQPRLTPAKSFYKPQNYPFPDDVRMWLFMGRSTGAQVRPDDTTLLVWRTDEQPAAAPKLVAEADAKIVAAWKRIRARELAKAAADNLAKETAAFGTSEQTATGRFLDLHDAFRKSFVDQPAKDAARYFILSDVCPLPLTPVFSARFEQTQNQYQPFRLKPSRDILYPTAAMNNELLDLRKKPASSAIVQADAGKNNYYVAMVQKRDEPSEKDFYDRVFPGRGELAGMVGGALREDEAVKANANAIALLKAEFKVEKENEKLLSEKGDVE